MFMYLPPDNNLPVKIQKAAEKNTGYACRKRVKCNACCACGEKTWEVNWNPEKDFKYVYGILVNFTQKTATEVPIYNLSGHPSCELLDREKQRLKHACSKEQGEERCKKVPGN